MRRRSRRGTHGLSGSAGARDPRHVYNAQGAARDADLGPELRLDARGRVRVREMPVRAAQVRLGAGLQALADGSVAVRPGDAVADAGTLDTGADLPTTVAAVQGALDTLNATLQALRAAGFLRA